MNLLPSEIFAVLYLLIPMGLVAYRWQYDIAWWKLWLICASLSWVFFNTYMAIDPPNNGFANFVYLVTGWFWMLPMFGLMLFSDLLLMRIFRNISQSPWRSRLGRIGFSTFLVASALCFLWGLFGQMSRDRAIIEARNELLNRGYEIVGPEDAVFLDRHWVIRYPESKFQEIRLNRNGSMSWIGGPG